MENKYFTPDIEDLYVGYKLEIKGKHDTNWQPVVLGKDAIWHKFTNLENLGQVMEQLRVPYLTKEQIEAEGWDFESMDRDYLYFIKINLLLSYNIYTHRLVIMSTLKADQTENYFQPSFKGECKDINTFRKIIKLLKL
jgi:hypothetical protein